MTDGDGPPRRAPSPTVSREMLETLFVGLDAGVYVTTDESGIITVNPAAQRILRRPAKDFIGRDAHELLHRESDGRVAPQATCPLLRASLSAQPTAGMGGIWFARGDDTITPVGWFSGPYRTDAGPGGVIVLFYELSEEQENRRAREGALSALESLTERLALVSETTTVLTSTLNVREALERLVRLVVPRLADWAVVDILEEDESYRRAVVTQHAAGRRTDVPELHRTLPQPPRLPYMPLGEVLRGGAARMVTREEYLAHPEADDELTAVQRQLVARTGMRSAIMAPLRGPRATVGAITLLRGAGEPEFDPSDLALLDEIAHRAGLAVDNARLYARQRHIAETMQRHLLPTLPELKAFELAARYRPSPHESQVGGDWYDAFLLPDGATAMMVGDVVGHDLQAAGRMSQVRNMLRGFAWDRQGPPSLVVGRLDQALLHISDAPLVTLVFGRLEEHTDGAWRLRWTNAGHPPPLLLRDGEASFPDEEHDPLLGTGVPVERQDSAVALPPGSTLVMYTDGLVEGPGLTMDEGLARLRRHAVELADLPLAEFCDTLIERTRPRQHDDDIVVLAFRARRAPG